LGPQGWAALEMESAMALEMESAMVLVLELESQQ
jgi:hypothetical protein